MFENGTGPQIEEWGGFGGGFDYVGDRQLGRPLERDSVCGATSPDNIQAFTSEPHPGRILSLGVLYRRQPDHRLTKRPLWVHQEHRCRLARQYLPRRPGEGAKSTSSSRAANSSRASRKQSSALPDRRRRRPDQRQRPDRRRGSAAIDEFSRAGEFLAEINGSETPAGSFGIRAVLLPLRIAFNSEGYLYVADREHGVVDIFTPDVPLPKVSYEPTSNPEQTSVTLNAKVDPNGDEVTGCYFEYGTSTVYGSPHIPCSPAPPYSGTGETVVSANISGTQPRDHISLPRRGHRCERPSEEEVLTRPSPSTPWQT